MNKKFFTLSKRALFYMCILGSIHTPFRNVNTVYSILKEISHWNTPPTPGKGFTVWKTQIHTRKPTVAKTRKYKKSTDAALKKEMKPCRKCNLKRSG